MDLDKIKDIIGVAIPTVNDMNLIEKYGLVNWLVVFLAKAGVIIFVGYIFFSKFELQWPIRKRRKN